MKKIEKQKHNLTDIIADYYINDEDDDRMMKIKKILFHYLTEVERNILLIYAETKSQRKTAKKMKVSPTTINFALREIRNKIIEKLNESTNNDTYIN